MSRSATRSSGMPCGCDPANDHPCAGHASHRDVSTLCIGGVFIQGPLDPDGRLRIWGSSENALSRFEADDLATEIQRRLKPRGDAT